MKFCPFMYSDRGPRACGEENCGLWVGKKTGGCGIVVLAKNSKFLNQIEDRINDVVIEVRNLQRADEREAR